MVNQYSCPDFKVYLPCQCYFKYPLLANFEVECIDVSTKDVSIAFNSIATEIEFRTLLLRPIAFFIPKDIFANCRVMDTIEISGKYYIPEKMRLEIHSEAFQSSRNSVRQITISSWDLKTLTFEFLKGFNQTKVLCIYDSINFHLHNFPSLPNLIGLYVIGSQGPNEWEYFPNLFNGLVHLQLESVGLNDDAADRILEWIKTGPSCDTLNHLNLGRNNLTRIPGQLHLFHQLNWIHLGDQQGKGFGILPALNLSRPIQYLNFANSSIRSIESDTFHG